MKTRPKRLYDYLFSGNGYKIRLALCQLGINVEYQFLDIPGGETRTRQFLEINPMGQIPVLELQDGTMLRESNAILFWLTEGTWLMPGNLLQRARVMQWMFFEQGNIDKIIGRARFRRKFPEFMETPQHDIEYWHATGNAALALIDSVLNNSQFLVGDSYTTADIALFGYVHCANEGGFDLDQYPAVNSWIQRVIDQPAYIPIDVHPEEISNQRLGLLLSWS